jgi:hypothetical protein
MEAASITNAPRLGDHREAPSARGLLSGDFGCASQRMLGPRSVENHETGCGVPGVSRTVIEAAHRAATRFFNIRLHMRS